MIEVKPSSAAAMFVHGAAENFTRGLLTEPAAPGDRAHLPVRRAEKMDPMVALRSE